MPRDPGHTLPAIDPADPVYQCVILTDDKGDPCERCGFPSGPQHGRELKPSGKPPAPKLLNPYGGPP